MTKSEKYNSWFTNLIKNFAKLTGKPDFQAKWDATTDIIKRKIVQHLIDCGQIKIPMELTQNDRNK